MLHFEAWKRLVILIVFLAGLLFALPNIVSLPFLPGKSINLGLDLRGGSHLLLRTDVNAVVSERLSDIAEGIRISLREEKVKFKSLSSNNDTVSFVIRDNDDYSKRDNILKEFGDDFVVETNGDTTRIKFSESGFLELQSRTVEQAIEIIRRRLDPDGTKEPVIQRQGVDRILVQVPGIDDPERVKALLGRTARLTFQLVDMRITGAEAKSSGRVPPGSVLLESSSNEGQYYVVEKRVMVSGDMLETASAGFDQNNSPAINFSLNSIGAKKFATVTGNNIGRPFAIILDGLVVSAPTIRAQIFANGQITGDFSIQESNDLALVLRAGALPAPLTVLEERSIGPGLGADSIAAGQIAAIVGVILVILFIVLSYGIYGAMASVGLLVNLMLILGALSLLQATLTLPGIAGIVLTMGMAVDSNVLIFERIREELRRGRAVRDAIMAGYSRAIATIIDANLTTLIASILLYVFGSGPVRGFSVTLGIGIITSLFTAILFTRMLIVLWINATKPKTLVI